MKIAVLCQALLQIRCLSTETSILHEYRDAILFDDRDECYESFVRVVLRSPSMSPTPTSGAFRLRSTSLVGIKAGGFIY